MGLEKYCGGEYSIVCSCEGTAEEDVINWLLDEEKLLFKRNDLVGERRYKITRLRSAEKIQEKILSLDFDKPVVIFRVLDSKKEKFKLGNLYKERHDVISFRTNPEIEVLMITLRGDLHKYINKHSKTKASKYAESQYKIKNIKSSGTVYEFFSGNVNLLIDSLREHKQKLGKGHLTIFDLLK